MMKRRASRIKTPVTRWSAAFATGLSAPRVMQHAAATAQVIPEDLGEFTVVGRCQPLQGPVDEKRPTTGQAAAIFAEDIGIDARDTF